MHLILKIIFKRLLICSACTYTSAWHSLTRCWCQLGTAVKERQLKLRRQNPISEKYFEKVEQQQLRELKLQNSLPLWIWPRSLINKCIKDNVKFGINLLANYVVFLLLQSWIIYWFLFMMTLLLWHMLWNTSEIWKVNEWWLQSWLPKLNVRTPQFNFFVLLIREHNITLKVYLNLNKMGMAPYTDDNERETAAVSESHYSSLNNIRDLKAGNNFWTTPQCLLLE